MARDRAVLALVLAPALVSVVAACTRDEAGCPRFASAEGHDGCACANGAVLLAGGCVSQKTADDFCGEAARYGEGACRLVDCPLGQSIDVATGACLPMRAVRALAHEEHIALAKHETLGCAGFRPAVLEGGHASCVPDEVLCPRGSTWAAAPPTDAGTREGTCVPAPLCDPGAVADPESGMCLRVVTKGKHVDVGRWVRAVLGADGGMGTTALCGPLALRPSLFAPAGGANGRVRATLEIIFPDADVTQLYARVTVVDDASGQPLSPDSADVVDAAARPLFEALRAIGGEATAGAVKTTVRCDVRITGHPVSVPLRGPAELEHGPAADAGADDDDEE